MLRTFLILIILGFASSLASAGDLAAQAKSKVLDLDDELIGPGTQVNFPGGYYRILADGHETDREDLHCRKIEGSIDGKTSTEIHCFLNRERKMVTVEAKQFVPDPVVTATLKTGESKDVSH